MPSVGTHVIVRTTAQAYVANLSRHVSAIRARMGRGVATHPGVSVIPSATAFLGLRGICVRLTLMSVPPTRVDNMVSPRVTRTF